MLQKKIGTEPQGMDSGYNERHNALRHPYL